MKIRKDSKTGKSSENHLKKTTGWPDMSPLYEEMWDKYVPFSGNADTKFGELLRNASRVIYRYYNDGDMYNYGYGKETVNPSIQYLLNHSDGYMITVVNRIVGYMDDAIEDFENDDDYDYGYDDDEDDAYDYGYSREDKHQRFKSKYSEGYDELLNELAFAVEMMCEKQVEVEQSVSDFYSSPAMKSKRKSELRKSTEALIFYDGYWYLMRSSGYPDYVTEEFDRLMERADADVALENMAEFDVDGSRWIGNVSHYYLVEGDVDYATIKEISMDEARQICDNGYSASAKKSKLRKGIIQSQLGMTLGEFFKENKSSTDDSIYGFDYYKVQLDTGEKVGDNYTGIPPNYHGCKVIDWHWEDLVDFDMLVITIACPEGMSKQYTPNYLGFSDMVNKLRNTRNTDNVFRE